MNLLLDTCALLALAEGTLPKEAHRILQSCNDALVPAVVVWEIAIKFGAGDLALSAPYKLWMNQAIRQLGADVLHINVDYADVQSRLPRHHGDPFDRLIIAQALAEGMPVVSSDAQFDRYGVTRIW